MDNGYSLADISAATGGMDGFGSGGAWVMIILFALIFGGGGFFGNNGYHPQYATQDFVQNGFNFNDLQDQNRDIMNAVTGGTAQAVAATNQAKYDNINVAKDIQMALAAQINDVKSIEQTLSANQSECCCNTLRAIDGVNYNAAMNTAAINENMTAQTQKILDALSANRISELQNRVNQLELASATSNVLRYPTSWTYNAGMSPFCGCGCGVGV